MKNGTRERSYIRSLCDAPAPYFPGPHVLRGIASFLLALPIVYLTMAAADGEHIPTALVYVLSPGFIMGLHWMSTASGFFDALARFGEVAIPVNVIYWSSLLFGLFSLIERRKSRAERGSPPPGGPQT
jgi:hypothetical protein